MKAVCPKDKEHKLFITTAHVVQEWVVDENGDFNSVAKECIETLHGPQMENSWTCKICGAEASLSEEV
ncbi:hypothetical protein ACOMCU_01545 [Lysinibacillus sp. UGB7]|uniref:hypothetical protein n=1 Tax=Lysinibacillus sp. UGB7 TaxID=3411039 RepID=UPI003B7A8073